MSNIYRTAGGKQINMDSLRIANESVIAVGNMRTNARGDQLGPGGNVVKSRTQLLQDYHKLNTPVINHSPLEEDSAPANDIKAAMANTRKLKTPTIGAAPNPVIEEEEVSEPGYVKPRGSFAEAVAGQTEVSTELLDPKPLNGSLGSQAQGVQRI
jgi:hypothetical protein